MELLIVAPPAGYREVLGSLPSGTRMAKAFNKGPFPFVQLFISELADLDRCVPGYLTMADENALVWISYPKMRRNGAVGLSRDKVRAILKYLGWRAVSIIAIDDIWSALRFRPFLAVTHRRSGSNN